MKIAVIGNSHAVAIKESLLAARTEPKNEWSVDFYAATARDAHRIAVKNNKVVPLNDRVKRFYEITSKGEGYVDVKEYDVVWVYGLTEQLDKIGSWYQNVKLRGCFSEEVKKKSFVDRYNVGISLARDLSVLCDRVFVSPKPMPSNSELIDNFCNNTTDSMQPVISFMDERARIAGATFLTQPNESLTGDGKYQTDPKYSSGSSSLSFKNGFLGVGDNEKSVRQDYLHMNGEFGDLMWREFYKNLLGKV